MRPRRVEIREPREVGGRDPGAAAERLRERLGTFEPRRRRRRPETGDSRRLQRIDDTGGERRLRPHHDEVDAQVAAPGDHGGEIHDVEVDAFGVPRDAAIARRAIELVAKRRGADGPAEGVFAPARPDHEHVHGAISDAAANPVNAARERLGLGVMTHPSPTSPAAAPNVREYTVGEIARQVKRTVEGAFERVRVRGEISGLTKAASGHLYLSLKDKSAAIDTVAWRSTAARLGIRPEDGMEVVCEGRLSTYAPRSRYQLIVDSMAVAGVGALLALLEERRRKLAAEGLFDDLAQTPHPLPARQRGRRDFAIGRRAPRCAAADRRPLSAPRLRLAGAGPGGRSGGGDHPRHFRFQPPGRGLRRAAPGRSDRRPRRRQHRGLVGVQRGRGRARRRGERNPPDQRGGARNRYDLDRPLRPTGGRRRRPRRRKKRFPCAPN